MERIVTTALGNHCIITEPDFGTAHRVVLGVHGLGGSARDQIQENTAEEMAFFGYAMVRTAFPGHGDSPIQELNLKACQETLLDGARCAMAEFPDVEGLCIFATGFGAYVTLSVLEELQELTSDLRLVVHTPSVLMHQTLLSMIQMSKQTFRMMDKMVFPLERPLTVTYNFYKELEENIVLMPHDIPMLILHGEQDDYIPMEHIQNFRRVNEESKLVIIPGASHRFLEEGVWDMVLDLTRDWFEFRQVLLADWI